MFIEISSNLKKLSKFFPENLYVVGGYVRNKLLKISGGDVDITSCVDIDEVSKRLAGSDFLVKVKNLKFGSLQISINDETYEYTAFRKEVYKKNGSHCPVKVESTNKIEEDAVRRDFTVNSIYYNINKDECVDLYHGIIDTNQRLLRCNIDPNEILKNDGERILRMVRFAGELGFKIEKQTKKAAIKYASNLSSIHGERKYNEIEKILYCDKRYNQKKTNLKKALNLLNELGTWQFFGLKTKKIRYKMVYKTEDRVLGLLIDIIDNEKPECLQSFVEDFLKVQFGFNSSLTNKVFTYLAGYYDALSGVNNKEYFFKYFEDWAYIYSLLGNKSKHIQNKYNFFYRYIIEHELVIKVGDLKISEDDIKNNFENIDKRNYNKILNNLLDKVFDGKLPNQKEDLLNEIEKNLKNF